MAETTCTIIYKPSRKRKYKYTPWVVQIWHGNDPPPIELRCYSQEDAQQEVKRFKGQS